ncbi:unnamed protein product [Amoebophrya sp. A120]|nr:unnamed protein product [Amoebophrya sp. A120]|eukprot:GSA120T00013731001.1
MAQDHDKVERRRREERQCGRRRAGEDVDRREATGNEAGYGVPSSEEDENEEEADFQHQNTATKLVEKAKQAAMPADEAGRDIDDTGPPPPPPPREKILTTPAEHVLSQGIKPRQEDTKNSSKSSKETLLPREEDEEEIIPADNMAVEVVKEDKRPAADVSSPNPVVNDAGIAAENAGDTATATALVHPGEADRELLLKLLQVTKPARTGLSRVWGKF